MAMGDLVLTEDELPRVMSRLQEGGIEQTAVHHHVMRETPRVLYMRVHAHGDAVKIARTLRAEVALTATLVAASNSAPAAPVALHTVGIASALGHVGRSNDGVCQVSTPRPAHDDAVKLARGLRGALDSTAIRPR